MGKSNRIRVKRVDTKKMSAPKKKQQGMPGWAMSLIAVVVAVVILSAAVLTFMSTNGVFGRMQTAMESENYSINKNVFSYYFYSILQFSAPTIILYTFNFTDNVFLI